MTKKANLIKKRAWRRECHFRKKTGLTSEQAKKLLCDPVIYEHWEAHLVVIKDVS